MVTKKIDMAEVDEPMVRLEDLPGYELLRPIETLKASTKGRLIARLTALEEDTTEDNLDIMFDLLDDISKYAAIDSEAFDLWTAEDGNFTPALELAGAFVTRLGESIGSGKN